MPVKANILIDHNGHARLADFGFLTIISDRLSTNSSTQGGTTRWMSPELLNPQRFGLKKSRPTKSSDCYALGMVIYETISGHLPFHQHSNPTVVLMVSSGERPLRKAWFTDSLWEMLELCWEHQPNARPSVEGVLQHLGMEPPLPRPDVGMEDVDSGWCSGWFFWQIFSRHPLCNVSRPLFHDRRHADTR